MFFLVTAQGQVGGIADPCQTVGEALDRAAFLLNKHFVNVSIKDPSGRKYTINEFKAAYHIN
ncbi:hypothetical protein [Methylobacterium nodulans]|uniref:Uncharacterized protein n=1 Tax=Methylobacterium nodulans (strain LMG 21967 / CNCM I-2342 / ORS 2060) TaxID=460265 RepID=B8IAR6_METNO|nr:hypothetical protein [Methylobacterium nodulans]ACL61111.1 hypothetical protein Mnod_6314 [Methylobacterium nodulans ORS 2060]